MVTVVRTNSQNQDFQKLVPLLDAELKIRDGEDHNFYAKFNQVDALKHVIVAYEGVLPVGCGAVKHFESGIMEIKRMFVVFEKRKAGIAQRIVQHLEEWAAEMEYRKCILETGINQPEAIALYLKCGYTRIANYAQYTNVETSLCFEKELGKLPS